MIPGPDLTFEWLMGIFGILIMVVWGGVGLWKIDSKYSVHLIYAGMTIGFMFIILGLNGAVGLADFTDGKVDLLRDEITQEILITECENLRQLSYEYKKSDIGKYTIGQIEDEIQEEFLYKCVDTREMWWK